MLKRIQVKEMEIQLDALDKAQSMLEAGDSEGAKALSRAIQSQYGMGIEEYLDAEMAAALDPEVLSEQFAEVENYEGFYNFKDGRLYLADTEEELANELSYVEYTLEGNTLTIAEGTDDSFAELADLGIKLPLIFEKN